MEPDDFTPPVRQSKSDDELADLVKNSQSDEAALLRAMEILGEQAKLREQDEQSFAAWAAKLEALGTKEAKLAVTNAKRALEGLPALEPEPVAEDLPVEPTQIAEEPLPAPVKAPILPETELVAATEPAAPETYADVEEIRPMSALAEIGITAAQVAPETEKLEHDLEQVGNADQNGEIIDVEVSINRGVAVSDFDAILSKQDFDFDESFEPKDFNSEQNLGSQDQQLGPKTAKPLTQFWAWLGLASGILPIGLGFTLAAFGLHGLQAFLALLFGVVASGVVVSIGAVAGKRSGLPTLTLSRATFGVYGNLIPGVALVVVKILAVSIFGLASLEILNGHLFSLQLNSPLLASSSSSHLVWALAVLGSLFLVALILSIFGELVTYRAQQIIGIVGLLAPLLVVSQFPLDVTILFTDQQESWWLTIAAGLLIFAGLGGLWSTASADFAKGIAASASGFKVYGFAQLGFTVLPLISGSVGILLADSAKPQAVDFIGSLSSSSWMSITVVSLACLAIMGLLLMANSSVVFALNGLAVKLNRNLSTWLVAIIALGLSLVLFANQVSAWKLVADYLPVAGVLLLSWTGTFIAEVLIRRIAYHEVSLQRAYGIYKSFNWVSLAGFFVSVIVGFGFVSSAGQGVTWVGYLSKLFANSSFWNEAQLGLAFAFLVSALVPVAFGIGRIKRQEAEVLAIENRRNDLDNVQF